ncbi:acyl carrier protein [Candidatus Dependentiae bacterium]|nr:acyl carrier protein [Candidatus Dependentiae bacterium]
MANFDSQDTYQKMVTIISDVLHVDKQKVTRDTSLEQLGADSLDKLEIVMKLEEEFGIEIEDQEAAKIDSINEAVEKINGLRTK